MNFIQGNLIKYLKVVLAFSCASCTLPSCKSVTESEPIVPQARYNLKFSALAKSWDEAIPLGNGMLGALIWEKGNILSWHI